MHRRHALHLLAGTSISLTGCLGQNTTPNQSTTSPAETQTQTPPPETRATTDDLQIDVPPCPEKPDTLTRDTALQFARQFEKALVTREVISGQNAEEIISIDVSIQEDTTEVTRTDDGWVVRFDVIAPAVEYESGHTDPGMYVVNYLVTDRNVFRAQATEAVAPRKEGVSVSCVTEY
ncbi:hypothetical protein [Halorussus halophilus]|uniref:hypothetical protein n=1 Tax=Halorussus halophilus TaxID=2650975 RepID=UPI001300E285|nr:hypothetical protein [Halorussus halophilus]